MVHSVLQNGSFWSVKWLVLKIETIFLDFLKHFFQEMTAFMPKKRKIFLARFFGTKCLQSRGCFSPLRNPVSTFPCGSATPCGFLIPNWRRKNNTKILALDIKFVSLLDDLTSHLMKRSLLVLIIWGCSLLTIAQAQPLRMMSQIPLASALDARCLLFDSYGMMWIGTEQ